MKHSDDDKKNDYSEDDCDEEMKSDQEEEAEDEASGSGSDKSDSGDIELMDGSNKKKQKRRSKNDFMGRDHKCNYCDKTYLSYPALYTHMKNKHAKGPDG